MKLTILLQDTAMGSSDDSARGLYSLWKTAGKGSGGLHVSGAVIKEIIITREENDTDGALNGCSAPAAYIMTFVSTRITAAAPWAA